MSTARNETLDEKDNETPSAPMTAAQVLEKLLSTPPNIKSKKIDHESTYSFGSQGFNYHSGSYGQVESYEQASNDIIRAEAAMKLGLVLSPLSRPDALFYVKPEEYPKQLAEAEHLKNEEELEKNQWSCRIL